jgi:pyruvate ferredoxin oxidoreductase gamma subunit
VWSNEGAGTVPPLECPDFSLSWSAEGPGEEAPSARLLGVDYRYCKGCLRCIETCPTEAMTREAETPGLADRLQVPLFPEITKRAGGIRGD